MGFINEYPVHMPDLDKLAREGMAFINAFSTCPIYAASDSWDGWTPPGPRRHGFDFWYAYNCNGKHFDPNHWKDSAERIDIDRWSLAHETDIAIEFIEILQI
jgi:hypothetical protein